MATDHLEQPKIAPDSKAIASSLSKSKPAPLSVKDAKQQDIYDLSDACVDLGQAIMVNYPYLTQAIERHNINWWAAKSQASPENLQKIATSCSDILDKMFTILNTIHLLNAKLAELTEALEKTKSKSIALFSPQTTNTLLEEVVAAKQEVEDEVTRYSADVVGLLYNFQQHLIEARQSKLINLIKIGASDKNHGHLIELLKTCEEPEDSQWEFDELQDFIFESVLENLHPEEIVSSNQI